MTDHELAKTILGGVGLFLFLVLSWCVAGFFVQREMKRRRDRIAVGEEGQRAPDTPKRGEFYTERDRATESPEFMAELRSLATPMQEADAFDDANPLMRLAHGLWIAGRRSGQLAAMDCCDDIHSRVCEIAAGWGWPDAGGELGSTAALNWMNSARQPRSMRDHPPDGQPVWLLVPARYDSIFEYDKWRHADGSEAPDESATGWLERSPGGGDSGV